MKIAYALLAMALLSAHTVKNKAPEPFPGKTAHEQEACNKVIVTWADEGTKEWKEHMHQCLYLDPDYLVEISPKDDTSSDYLVEQFPAKEEE